LDHVFFAKLPEVVIRQQSNVLDLTNSTGLFFNLRCPSAAYRQKFKDIGHLKQDLNSCWVMTSQELINGAIDQWSK